MRSGGLKHDALDQVHYGLYYGVVTDNVDPDNKDRIKSGEFFTDEEILKEMESIPEWR